ncbi:DUF2000 family protein [Peribacillus sp. NPDC060253]|uniref:DUF2000 family protein n=1 Tax=Peribacillus sp. NPDC060253 TaxID=3347084 RepID=UPI003655A7E5
MQVTGHAQETTATQLISYIFKEVNNLFDTKFVIVLHEDLETLQKLNVTAFLTSGIAGTQSDLIGIVC